MDTRDLDRRAKWVARWRASGLSAREFGGQHGLTAAQLYSWSRQGRADEDADADAGTASPPFTEVRVRDDPSSQPRPSNLSPVIEVDIGRRVIRIPAGVDLDLIEAVLAAVSRC